MSIQGEKGELLRLPNFWAFCFKLAMICIPIMAGTGLSVAGWLVMKVLNHDTQLAVLESRIAPYIAHAPSNVNTNTLIASEHPDTSKRLYLTTADVAKNERVAIRTVTDWIEKGRIDPPPIKGTKGWTISANYRILPQDAASTACP